MAFLNRKIPYLLGCFQASVFGIATNVPVDYLFLTPGRKTARGELWGNKSRKRLRCNRKSRIFQ